MIRLSQSQVPEPAPFAAGPDGVPTSLATEAAPDAPRAEWHGMASVWGSVCGVILAAVVVGAPSLPEISPYAVAWGLGLVMLLVRGRVRQFGVGLVASGLVGPTLMAWGQVQNAMWLRP